ncbi:hypothetical protein [Gardnerella sp. 2492-Sm]|uniref:hypothetical protein n=1 Tax=unclassified Gardnerella TaxID=2628112 RepID=UPI003D07C72C
MKRRIGCWIALAFTLALAIFVHCNDRYGFDTMVMIIFILPTILLIVNIVASFDKKLLIEVPILSIAIVVITEIVTFSKTHFSLGLYIGYCMPTFIVSVVVFSLTRYLKTNLVTHLTYELENNKTD